MSRKVTKGLTPEEMTAIENIESVVSQLKQMAGQPAEKAAKISDLAPHEGEEIKKGDEVLGVRGRTEGNEEKKEASDMMGEESKEAKKSRLMKELAALEEEDTKDKDANKAKKAIVTAHTDEKLPTMGEGEANLAEYLLDILPDDDREAVSFVNKARALKKSLEVKNDVGANKLLAKMAKSLEILANRQMEVEKAIGHIAEGVGLADAVVAPAPVAKSENRGPVMNNDAVAMLAEVLKSAGIVNKSVEEKRPEYTDVRKGLGETMAAWLGGDVVRK